jgi:hypothetical protein
MGLRDAFMMSDIHCAVGNRPVYIFTYVRTLITLRSYMTNTNVCKHFSEISGFSLRMWVVIAPVAFNLKSQIVLIRLERVDGRR